MSVTEAAFQQTGCFYFVTLYLYMGFNAGLITIGVGMDVRKVAWIANANTHVQVPESHSNVIWWGKNIAAVILKIFRIDFYFTLYRIKWQLSSTDIWDYSMFKHRHVLKPAGWKQTLTWLILQECCYLSADVSVPPAGWFQLAEVLCRQRTQWEPQL